MTCIGFISRKTSQAPTKAWLRNKNFLIATTFIRFLSCMHLMNNEVFPFVCRFFTFITFTEFLSSVNVLICNEALLLGKDTSTLIYILGSLSSVDCPTLCEMRFATDMGIAHSILTRSLHMPSLILKERWHSNTSFPTHLQGVFLESWAWAFSRTAEGFSTFITFIWFPPYVDS